MHRLSLSLKRGTRAFALMEVIVALTILGVSVGAIMRSFTISMAAIRKNDVSQQAFILAESLLQTLEASPVDKGKTSGDFSEEGFPNFQWELEIKEEEIRYRNLKTTNRVENLRNLKHVKLRIIYDDRRLKRQVPVEVDLILPPIERFSYESKFLNELFREEVR